MLTNRDVILVKPEVTYNVDSVPTAALNAILVENPSWKFEGLRMIDRPSIRASIGKLQKIFGGALKAVSFDVEIKGSGALGTAPELGPLLLGAGYSETIVPATSVTYDLVSDAATHTSVTIYYYQDGIEHKITGARCMSISQSIEVGSPGKLSMVFVGHDAGHSDVALPSPTYDSQVPYPAINASFAVGGYAAVVSKLEYDIGLTLAKPPDLNAVDGYGELLITDRSPTGSFDPEAVLVATNDFIGDFKSGTKMALTTGDIGSTAGNKWKLSIGEIYYTDITPGDREGKRTFEIPFAATDETTTDNECTFVFT